MDRESFLPPSFVAEFPSTCQSIYSLAPRSPAGVDGTFLALRLALARLIASFSGILDSILDSLERLQIINLDLK
jgi:hypothetical protein